MFPENTNQLRNYVLILPDLPAIFFHYDWKLIYALLCDIDLNPA